MEANTDINPGSRVIHARINVFSLWTNIPRTGIFELIFKGSLPWQFCRVSLQWKFRELNP
jgi:hypothetical protein